MRGDPIIWGGPLATMRRVRLLRDAWAIGPRPIGQLAFASAALAGPHAIADLDHELARIVEQAALIRRLRGDDWPDLALHAIGGRR